MSLSKLLDQGINQSDNESEDSDNEIDNTDVGDSDKDELIIKNPFFKNQDKFLVNNRLIDISEMEIGQIYENFNCLYVICLKEGNTNIESFYEDELSIFKLKKVIQSLEIIKTDLRLIKNINHKLHVSMVDNHYLKLFSTAYEFNDKELVLPLINIKLETFKLYYNQYSNIFSIYDYVRLKIVNEFYNKSFESGYHLTTVIKNSESTNYWTFPSNCKLNLTSKFMDRTYPTYDKFSDKNIAKVIKKINDDDNDDTYLSYIYRKSKYVDISSIVKRNGFSLYKITNNTKLDYDMINNVLDKSSSRYELYTLTMNLLISKEECHLVLNNKYYMDKLTNHDFVSPYGTHMKISLIEKYLPAFQYAMGYSCLTLYTEECIKKTFITKDDRFVFDINTASMLPSFPLEVSNNNYRYNPYLPILVSNEIIDIEKNILGVKIEETPNRINSFNEFQSRLNLFMTSNYDTNIFHGIDMTNLAISGSVIPACVPSYNPLIGMFPSLDRYFQEYYVRSDLDVMCNLEDIFDYIDRVNCFYNEINDNCKKYFSESCNLMSIKNGVIIVNESFIQKNIVDKKFSFTYIINHLNEDPYVKKKFYECYINDKIEKNTKYIRSDKWEKDIYNVYFDICNISDMKVIYVKSKNEYNKLSNQEVEYLNLDEELLKCCENIKYKISCNSLNHEFEVFKTKYAQDFFSAVSLFHLPCVRGYYTGDNVYLLPSCIFANMIFINIDTKYFAGSRDLFHIKNKYRNRGYGYLDNDKEKQKYIRYCNEVGEWKRLFNNFNIKSKISVNRNVLGYIDINSVFFKPRKILPKEYLNYKPVKSNYKHIDKDENSNLDHIDMYIHKLSHYTTSNFILLKNIYTLCNLKIMNHLGSPNVISPSKWYFDAIYEMIKIF